MTTISPGLCKPFLVLLLLLVPLISACSDNPHQLPLKITAQMVQYTKTSARIAVGASGSVTASCPAGEQMLSGGYGVDAFESANIMSSYPSGPNAWTVSTLNNASPSWIVLSASVNCLRANVSVGARIVRKTVNISYEAAQSATAQCPPGAVVTGGGYKTTGFVDASVPQASGWHVVAREGSKAEVFALCATNHISAAPSTSSPFAIPHCFGCYGSGKARCGTGQMLTGGGFRITDGNNRFLDNGAASDFSSWSVVAAGDGYSSTIPHPTAWATCALLS